MLRILPPAIGQWRFCMVEETELYSDYQSKIFKIAKKIGVLSLVGVFLLFHAERNIFETQKNKN